MNRTNVDLNSPFKFDYLDQMNNRTVKYLLPAEKIDMGGFPIKQALPTEKVDQVDPFLLLHHGRVKYSDHRKAISQGIGPHPHRGFSPVTFVIEGEVHHRDSRGHSQVARAGDVQWLTAGMGIIHSERPSQTLAQVRGYQEIVQLWVNSPAANKMDKPQYQFLSRESMPSFFSEDGGIQNNLIAGNLNHLSGNITTQSELIIIWSHAQENGSQLFQIPPSFNTALYLIKGEVNIQRYGLVSAEHLIVFSNDGSDTGLHFAPGSQSLLMGGIPLNEPTVRSGPFVMNTQTQILEALRDYKMGKMGVLIEDD